jgi:hypothetical protein
VLLRWVVLEVSISGYWNAVYKMLLRWVLPEVSVTGDQGYWNIAHNVAKVGSTKGVITGC